MVKASDNLTEPDVGEVEATPSPADLDRFCRDAAAVVRRHFPRAVWGKIVIGVADGPNVRRAVLPILLAAESQTAEEKVIAFLSQFSAGVWVRGKTIAAEIDMEYTGGQFSKLMSKLANDKKLLDSDRTQGYRLKRS